MKKNNILATVFVLSVLFCAIDVRLYRAVPPESEIESRSLGIACQVCLSAAAAIILTEEPFSCRPR